MKTYSWTVGVHDFDWLYTQCASQSTKQLIDKIIAIERAYLAGTPLPVSDTLYELHLGPNIIWTRENTTHSIPFGYVQIYKLLEEILPPAFREPMQGAIVDVGANEGHWSLYMQQNHPDAQIVAIEPNPIPRDLMMRNFKSNKIKHAVILPFAISREDGTRTFETIDTVTSLGSFSIDRTGRPWLTDDRITHIEVTCRKLDSIAEIKAQKVVDLLKIDVEGAEVEVLKSGPKTLSKTRRIEIEYSNPENHHKILQILEPLGFRLLLDHPYRPGTGDMFFIHNRV